MKTEFGPFVFDRAHQLLAREGQEVPLPPRVLGVLDVLTARPGQIVSKQELIETVWKDAFVSDTSLAEAVSFLRQALGDDPQQPSYIQTVHRRGYRFLPATADAVRTTTPVVQPAVARDATPLVVAYAAAILFAAVAASAVWQLSRPEPPSALPVTRFSVPLPAALHTALPSVAIAADGSRLAFAACSSGACRVYTRAMDETTATPIAGTDGGTAPFLSSDGTLLGFFADGKVKRIAIAGGTPVTIAPARQALGAAWLRDGSAVIAAAVSGAPGGLLRIGPASGLPRVVTTADAAAGEFALAWPEPLPGERAILATALLAPDDPQHSRIVGVSLDDGRRTVVLEQAAFARYVAPNTIVFVRRGVLMAAAFDPSQLKVVGQPVAVVPRVDERAPQFAVSRVGSFVAAAAANTRPSALAWVASDARVEPLAAGLQHLTSASLSDDGRKIAALALDDGRADVWSADLERGALGRLTFDGEYRAPLWSADGRALVFAMRAGGVFNLFVRRFDAAAPARLTTAGHHQLPSSVSKDGRLVAFTDFSPDTGADIWMAPIAGGAATAAVVRTPFDESAGTLSPDGRWLAYQSNESNRWEVYVRAVVSGGRSPQGSVVAISAGGGTSPAWSRDGRTLYYASPAGVMAVAMRVSCSGPDACELSASRPAPFVSGARGPWLPRGSGADGRLLVERAYADSDPIEQLTVTLQWPRELQRVVPSAVVASPK